MTNNLFPVNQIKERPHFKIIDKTYQNNISSDYTEKIEELGNTFKYTDHSNYYWGPTELSILYGTPLYEQASPSQKLALNHLYWVGQYNHTAAAETNTMLYNQVTAGVFSHLVGYETLCQELDFETSQERYHTHTFQKVGYKTKLALLGKTTMGNVVQNRVNQSKLGLKALASKKLNSPITSFQDFTFRSINKLMLPQQLSYYSQYLKERGNQPIPTTIGGLAGATASPTIFKFLTLSWGSSPFLACQYYSIRMVANMSLKLYEYKYYKHFKKLKSKDEFTPTPTAISYYHLLDESFHTTMSQIISQDIYKDFPKPSAYEKWLSNIIVLLAQKGVLGGLSGGIPATFRSDAAFMPWFYKMLQSPLFNMSSQEALYWMKKCLCEENNGFQKNMIHHQELLLSFRRFFGEIDYLWKINREMELMTKGGSIPHAIQSNIKAFEQFSKSV